MSNSTSGNPCQQSADWQLQLSHLQLHDSNNARTETVSPPAGGTVSDFDFSRASHKRSGPVQLPSNSDDQQNIMRALTNDNNTRGQRSYSPRASVITNFINQPSMQHGALHYGEQATKSPSTQLLSPTPLFMSPQNAVATSVDQRQRYTAGAPLHVNTIAITHVLVQFSRLYGVFYVPRELQNIIEIGQRVVCEGVLGAVIGSVVSNLTQFVRSTYIKQQQVAPSVNLYARLYPEELSGEGGTTGRPPLYSANLESGLSSDTLLQRLPCVLKKGSNQNKKKLYYVRHRDREALNTVRDLISRRETVHPKVWDVEYQTDFHVITIHLRGSSEEFGWGPAQYAGLGKYLEKPLRSRLVEFRHSELQPQLLHITHPLIGDLEFGDVPHSRMPRSGGGNSNNASSSSHPVASPAYMPSATYPQTAPGLATRAAAQFLNPVFHSSLPTMLSHDLGHLARDAPPGNVTFVQPQPPQVLPRAQLQNPFRWNQNAPLTMTPYVVIPAQVNLPKPYSNNYENQRYLPALSAVPNYAPQSQPPVVPNPQQPVVLFSWDGSQRFNVY